MPTNRPTFAKFGTQKRERYLAALREGKSRSTAARSVDVSRELVRLYRHAHAEFAAEEVSAEEEAHDAVEDALHAAALGGNVVAMQVYLYNRRPDRWKDRRNLKVSFDDEDLDSAIESELARLAAGRQGGVPGATADEAAAGGVGPRPGPDHGPRRNGS